MTLVCQGWAVLHKQAICVCSQCYVCVLASFYLGILQIPGQLLTDNGIVLVWLSLSLTPAMHRAEAGLGKGVREVKASCQGCFSERYICLSASERPMKLQMHLKKCPSEPWVIKWYPGRPHLPILPGFFDVGYTVRFQACPRELRIFLCLLRASLVAQLVK